MWQNFYGFALRSDFLVVGYWQLGFWVWELGFWMDPKSVVRESLDSRLPGSGPTDPKSVVREPRDSQALDS